MQTKWNNKRIPFCVAVFVFFCLGATTAHGQRFEEAMARAKSFYTDISSYRVNVTTMLYKGGSDPKPEHTIRGQVSKKDKSYCTEVEGRTLINNQRCALVVDRQNKLMVYSRPDWENKGAEELFKEFSNPDSLARAMVVISGAKIQEKTISYEIVSRRHSAETGEPYKTVITLNRENYTLFSVVYYFLPHPAAPYSKIVIKYATKAGEPAVSEVNFSEKKFIDMKAGKPVPAEGFEGYKVILKSKINPQID